MNKYSTSNLKTKVQKLVTKEMKENAKPQLVCPEIIPNCTKTKIKKDNRLKNILKYSKKARDEV